MGEEVYKYKIHKSLIDAEAQYSFISEGLLKTLNLNI